MASLVEPRRFVFDGNADQEQKDFQHFTFKGARIPHDKSVSFRRSDFRGSRLDDCIFSAADFSNTDLVSCYAMATTFIGCNFKGASILNSFFNHLAFEATSLESAEVIRSRISNSSFVGARFDTSTVRDVTFEKCRFSGCSFEMAGMEGVAFIDCDLSGEDISTMTATELSFVECDLTDVTVDPDYIGTYLFSETPRKSLKFRYRGNILDASLWDEGVISGIGKNLVEFERYHEFFNFSIQFGQANPSMAAVKLWPNLLHNISRLTNDMEARHQLQKMFGALEFFFSRGYIGLGAALQMLADAKSLAEQLEEGPFRWDLEDLIYRQDRAVTRGNYSWESLADETLTRLQCRLELRIRADQQESLDLIDAAFNSLRKTLTGVSETPIYTVLGVRPGSTIVDLATTAAIALALTKAAAIIAQTAMKIRIEHEIHTRMLSYVKEAPLEKVLVLKKKFDSSPAESKAIQTLVRALMEIVVKFHPPRDGA